MVTPDLLIPTGIILFSLLVAHHFSLWLLQFLSSRILLEEDEFFKHYENSTNARALKILSSSPDTLPDAYEVYVKFHRKKGKSAYSYCNRYLRIRAGFVSVTILLLLLIPLSFGKLYYWPSWSLPMTVAGFMAYRIFLQKRNLQFYLSLTIDAVFKKLGWKE